MKTCMRKWSDIIMRCTEKSKIHRIFFKYIAESFSRDQRIQLHALALLEHTRSQIKWFNILISMNIDRNS